MKSVLGQAVSPGCCILFEQGARAHATVTCGLAGGGPPRVALHSVWGTPALLQHVVPCPRTAYAVYGVCCAIQLVMHCCQSPRMHITQHFRQPARLWPETVVLLGSIYGANPPSCYAVCRSQQTVPQRQCLFLCSQLQLQDVCESGGCPMPTVVH